MGDATTEGHKERPRAAEPGSPENALYAKQHHRCPVKVYCEHHALTSEVKAWARAGSIELVHFPYDPQSHSRRIPGIAKPSAAQIKDLNLPIRDMPGAFGDCKASEHFVKILSIVGHQHRRDALHVDSAFKSGCSVFITRDSDILNQKDQLTDLLAIKFFDPVLEFLDLERFILSSNS